MPHSEQMWKGLIECEVFQLNTLRVMVENENLMRPSFHRRRSKQVEDLSPHPLACDNALSCLESLIKSSNYA